MDYEGLRTRLNNVINTWIDEQSRTTSDSGSQSEPDTAPDRELPKDKRAVRTKSSGDRVYILDDQTKTRRWVTNPEVLKSIGFEISDVVEVDDNELLSYQMAPALYRIVDEKD